MLLVLRRAIKSSMLEFVERLSSISLSIDVPLNNLSMELPRKLATAVMLALRWRSRIVECLKCVVVRRWTLLICHFSSAPGRTQRAEQLEQNEQADKYMKETDTPLALKETV